MGLIQNYPPLAGTDETLRTLTSEEAAAYWSKEAVAERELHAPQSWE